jgi:hypothetical protein
MVEREKNDREKRIEREKKDRERSLQYNMLICIWNKILELKLSNILLNQKPI